MGEALKIFLTILHGGGLEAMLLVMALVIVFLAFMLYRMHDDLRKKDERTDRIVENYQANNSILTEAINRLNQLIAEIKNKL